MRFTNLDFSLFSRSLPRLTFLVLAAGTLFSTGCANHFAIRVTARADDEPSPAGCYSLRAIPMGSSALPVAMRPASLIRRALAGKGLREAAEREAPTWLIVATYGVAPPTERQEIVSSPVYVMSPGPITYQTVVTTLPNGTTSSQIIAVQGPPIQSLAGYREDAVIVKTFRKYLRLQAFDYPRAMAGLEPGSIWNVTTWCEADDDKLDRVLPVLTAAAMVYVGKSSSGTEIIQMKDTDRDVARLLK